MFQYSGLNTKHKNEANSVSTRIFEVSYSRIFEYSAL